MAAKFLPYLLAGISVGGQYALIAIGYTMVYGILRLINFAHGDFIMIGAYTLFYTIPLMVDAGMPAWMAVIVAVAVCALVGVLVEILAYRPVRKAGPMSALITALAMSIFFGKPGHGAVLAPSRTTCRLFSACHHYGRRGIAAAERAADHWHRRCDDALHAAVCKKDQAGQGHARRPAG